MDRKVYISNGIIRLSEYRKAEDDPAFYASWTEPEVQEGFNCRFDLTFEQFKDGFLHSRFMAAVIRQPDEVCVGVVFLSADSTAPDLAIILYKPYRSMGYGTSAFSLGVRYCFEELKLERVYAGSYPANTASIKMLRNCGFARHPKGNQREQHYLTGEEIIQLDYVQENFGM